VKPKRLQSSERRTIQEVANFVAIFGDTAMVILGIFFAFWFRFKSGLIPLNETWWTSGGAFQDRPVSEYFGIIFIGGLLLILMFVQMGMYRSENLLRFKRVLLIICRGVFSWMLIYFSFSLVLKFNPPISRIYVLSSGCGVVTAVVVWRWFFHKAMLSPSIAIGLQQSLVFVGWTSDAARLSHAVCADMGQPYRIVGYISNSSEENAQNPKTLIRCIGKYSELENLINEHSIDILVLTGSQWRQEEMVELINLCARLMVKLKVIASGFQLLVSCLRLETISSVAILGVSETPLDNIGNRAIKRFIDIIGALVGIFGGIPVIITVGSIIFLESPGPIFFWQERVGRGGRKFRMIKLRSMRLDADKLDHLNQSTLRDDPRLLRIGGFIRKWNLDEIPQFYNVLIGQMSLVGPRPERTYHSETLSYEIPHYNSRLLCKPGITGWAQVNGLRGDTDLAERIRLDLYYLENWSVWLDLQIMVQTFITRKNAY
jgi:exopolysaccharide biosynthesis polyprenyl glycosylphosphotransferase